MPGEFYALDVQVQGWWLRRETFEVVDQSSYRRLRINNCHLHGNGLGYSVL